MKVKINTTDYFQYWRARSPYQNFVRWYLDLGNKEENKVFIHELERAFSEEEYETIRHELKASYFMERRWMEDLCDVREALYNIEKYFGEIALDYSKASSIEVLNVTSCLEDKLDKFRERLFKYSDEDEYKMILNIFKANGGKLRIDFQPTVSLGER